MSAAVTGVSANARSDVMARLRGYERLRPPLGRALRLDALRFAAQRGARYEYGSRLGEWWNVLKMCWSSDDYLGVALYRVRATLRAHHVPLIPSIINRLCIGLFRIEIGDGVVIREGVYIPHGNVVLAGITLIGRNNTLCPWMGTGCQEGSFVGPVLGDNVFVGTHSIILGPVSVGDGATIGAGAHVDTAVAPGDTIGGVVGRVSTEQVPAP